MRRPDAEPSAAADPRRIGYFQRVASCAAGAAERGRSAAEGAPMDVLDSELPLFVVCRAFSKQRDETNVAIGMIGPLTVASPNAPRAVALFTNRAGAERSRDAHAPTHGV